MSERRRPSLPRLAALALGLLGAVLPLPAAADQTNPAGVVISGRNPGLEATADGQTLHNTGRIEADGTNEAVGMGVLSSSAGFQNLTLGNSGSISADARGNTAASADAHAEAYGMRGGDGSTLANHGSISADARGGTATSTSTYADAGADADGMRGGDGSALTNHGSISAYARGGMATSTSTSISTYAASASASAYGMRGEDGSTLANHGSINADAWGGTATTAYAHTKASAYAYGMRSGDNSSLTNHGSISAYARGGTATNTATVDAAAARAYGEAYGMWGGDGSTLTNHGSISAYARGGTATNANGALDTYATADAIGMWGEGGSTLVNHDSISAYARGGTVTTTNALAIAYADANAYGMRGWDGSTLTNHGSISADARGGTATNANGALDTYAYADAYGMWGWDGSTLSNHGFISAYARSGTAPSAYAYAYGMRGGDGSTLTNHGSISAYARGGTATSAYAYGMRGGDGSTLTNHGVIRVNATGPGNLRAHELFVDNGSVHIRAWALDLRDFRDTATRPFGVGSVNGRLDFDGSTLIPRPGTDSQGFAWGREYAVRDMVATYNNGQATGTVATVATELPLLEARLRGSNWRDQTVSLHLNVNARTNPGQAVASLNAALAGARMTFMDSLLAAHLIPASGPQSGLAAGDDPGAAGVEWTGFLTPYYQHLSGNDPDYSAHSAGLAAGGSARFNHRLALGGHLGFDHTKSSGDLLDMDGRTLTGFAGLHGIWNITPAWYLRGQLTGFLSQSTRYWTGGRPEYPLSADADTDGHGLYAALRGGYVWNIDERHSLSPELGLDWLRTHQDAFSLNWTGRGRAEFPAYAMDFRAEDASVLSGTALLRWRGDFALAGGRLLPGLGLGVRQVLAGDDVRSRLRFAGTGFSTRAPADDTSALVEAGLAWTRNKVGVSLAYAGEYGPHRQSHAGRLSVRLEF